MATNTEYYKIDLDSKDMEDSLYNIDKSILTLNKNSKDLTKTNKELDKTNKELSKDYEKNSVEIEKNSVEIEKNNKTIFQNKETVKVQRKEYNELSKTIQQKNKITKIENETLEKQKLKLSLVTAEINKMSAEELVATDKGKKMIKQQEALTVALHDAEKAGGNFKRGVGDYNTEMGKTTKTFSILGGVSKKTLGRMNSGIKTAGKAFIATGIGAIIAGIVAGFMALKKAFTSSAKGQDAMAKGMGVLKGYIVAIMDVFKSFVPIVINAFKKPEEAWNSFKNALSSGVDFIKAQVIDRVSGSFSMMSGKLSKTFAQVKLSWAKIWNNEDDIKKAEKDIADANKQIEDGSKKLIKANTAIKDVYEEITIAVKGFNEEAKKAGEIATKILLAENAYKRYQATITVTNAELEKQLITQEQIADDATRSLVEREKAANNAIEIQAELAKNQLDDAERNENLLKRKQKLEDDYTLETIQAIADATATRIAAEGEVEQGAIEGTKRLAEIRSDAFEIALDAEVDFSEKKRAILLKTSEDESLPFEVRKKALKLAEKLSKDSYDRQIVMFEKMSGTQIDKTEIAKLNNAEEVDEYLTGLGLSEVLTNRFLNDVLNEQLQVNEDIKNSNKSVNDSKAEGEILSLETTLENDSLLYKEKQKALEKALETKQITQDEYDVKSKVLLDSETQRSTQAYEDMAKHAIEISNGINDAFKDFSQIRLNLTENEYNDEKQLLDDKFKDGTISEKEYNKSLFEAEKKKVIKENEINKTAFEAQQINDLLSVAINTAVAVSKSFATLGPILGIPGAALSVATGALSAGVILSKEFQPQPIPSMAAGGQYSGASHAGGGILTEVEGQEWTINKASSIKYNSILGAINNAGNTNGDVNEVNDIFDYEKLASVMQSQEVIIVDSKISDSQSEVNIRNSKTSF